MPSVQWSIAVVASSCECCFSTARKKRIVKKERGQKHPCKVPVSWGTQFEIMSGVYLSAQQWVYSQDNIQWLQDTLLIVLFRVTDSWRWLFTEAYHQISTGLTGCAWKNGTLYQKYVKLKETHLTRLETVVIASRTSANYWIKDLNPSMRNYSFWLLVMIFLKVLWLCYCS